MATLCKKCGTELVLDVFSNRMVCRTCGGSWKIDVEASAKHSSPDDEVVLIDEKEKTADEHFALDETLVDETMKCDFYTCRSCGGEFYQNGGDAPTTCIYCNQHSLTFSHSDFVQRPEFVLPFSVTKDQAVAAISKAFKRAMFVPSKLKHFQPSEIQSMYVPYWLVDGNHFEADTFSGKKIDFETTPISTTGQSLLFNRRSLYGRTEQRSAFVDSKRFGRAGKVRFRNLPMDASSILSDYSSARLEPFDISQIKEFEERDLQGHCSTVPDITYKDLYEAVKYRAEKEFQNECLESFKASDKTIVKSNSETIIDRNVHSILMPVYFASFMNRGHMETVMINGQSGKVVYGAHTNRGAFWATVIALSALVAIPITTVLRAIRLWCFGYTESLMEGVRNLPDYYNAERREEWINFANTTEVVYFMLVLGLLAVFVLSLRFYRKTSRKLSLAETATMCTFSRKKRG